MKIFNAARVGRVSPAFKGSLFPFALSVLALVAGCATNPAPTAPPTTAAASPNSPAPHSTAEKATSSASISKSSPAPAPAPGTQVLFDGKTLKGWTITDFAGHGEVQVEDGKLLLEMGVMTGVTYTNPFPKVNYEVELDATRLDGSDFFCGLTFPVGENPCSLILGGWGGTLVGLSSIDGEDAAHNETTKSMDFQKGRWYHVRLRVTKPKIEAWIDNEKLVDVNTEDKSFSIRIEMELSKPLGIATWSTTGAIKNIRLRKL